MSRFIAAWRAGWAAALARWREGADVPAAKRERVSFFACDPDALPSPRTADEEEARAFYASHFRRGPWTGMQ